MRKTLAIALIAIVLYPLGLNGQIPYFDSKKLIDSGVALYDNGGYKKALELYKQVPYGDTNYSASLYELVNTQIADSSFAEAKENARKGLALPFEDTKRFLIQLANLYDYLQKPDSSLYLYDSLSKLVPYDNQPHFEQGVLYFRQKKYDQAIACFQKSLLLNPAHIRSHYLLGIVYALQGRLTESYICLQGALMVCNNKQLAQKTIGMMSDIAKETEDVEKYYKEKDKKYNNEVFDETDQIINAKLALDAQYKPDIPLNDDVLKQMMVVMEKLSFSEKDNNFVMQYYVPLLTQIYKEKLTDGYMLLLFSDYDIKSIDEIAQKRKKDVEEVKKVIYPYLNKIKSTHELSYTKRVKARDKFHYSDGNYLVVGYLREDDKDKFEEGEALVYLNNSLVAKGKYNTNGEKDGEWRSWYASGQLKAEKTFHNNLETGETKDYSDMGNLRHVIQYGADGKVKEEKEYSYKGWLNSVSVYKDNGEKEVTYYYPNGRKETVYQFRDNKIKDGKYTLYFDNGSIKKEMEIKNGEETGICRKYFENGKLMEECTFENGKLEGLCTDYFESGKLKSKYFYHQDKLDNSFEDYFENGNLSVTGSYSNNKKEGEEKWYDHTGRLYTVFDYKDNALVSLKCMDPDNKVVYQRASQEGLHKYDLYYPSGLKSCSNSINTNGKRDGKVTFYFPSGAVKEADEYKDGKLVGISTEYFKNGNVKLEEHYKDGTRNGYYKMYYRNGKPQREGWYIDGKRTGTWKYYYINGTIQYEALYMEDENQGRLKVYNMAGELESNDIFYYDMIIGTEQFDSTGSMINREMYLKPKSHYRNIFKNGAVAFECDLLHGTYNGQKTRKYFNGTLSEKGYNSLGKRDSINISYFPDSKVMNSGNYRKGQKEGKWTYYDETGKVAWEENLLHDDDEGKTSLYACGLLRTEYNYKGGYKDGMQKYYGEAGKVAGVLYYYEGELIGYSYEDKDGKLLPMKDVKNGKAEIRTFYASGSKGLEFNVDGNEFMGKQMVYFSNGNLAEERSYTNTGLNGMMKKYFPNGKPGYEVNFVDDKMDGEEKIYNSNGENLVSTSYYYDYRHGATQVTDEATHKKHIYQYRYGVLVGVR